MLSTKIRTAIVVVGAMLTVVVATGPVAHAAINNGAYSRSSEAQKKRAHDQLCDDLWSIFEGDVNDADAKDKAGDIAGRNAALDNAAKDVKDARGVGCDWAARVAPPQRITAPVPVGLLAP